MKMSVARAMKERNRIASKMSDLRDTFSENVYIEGRIPSVDVKTNYDEYVRLQNALIELKKKISQANSKSGAIEVLYEKEELKCRLVALRGVNADTASTFNRNPVSGQMEEVKKFAFLDQNFLEKTKSELSSKIYELQDKIDELNATTFIEFEPMM